MAISFDCSYFRIFRPPKLGKKLPKTAAFPY
jgi:hypothetical protein